MTVVVRVYDGDAVKDDGDMSASIVLGLLLRDAGCTVREPSGRLHTTYVTPAGNHLVVEIEDGR